MKTLLAALLATLISATALADVTPPEPVCPSGGSWVPWRLPAVENAETPIFAGLNNTRVATVCNCTKADQGADAGTWIATQQRDPKAAGLKHGRTILRDNAIRDFEPGPGQDYYYLAGGACTIVGPGSVILRTADHRGPKWGMWLLDK